MVKERIVKAYLSAKEKHKGQKRKYSNLDYITHPKAVARIIEKHTEDEDMVIASLLHDIVEDTDTTIDEVKKEFGDRVAGLVAELTVDAERKKEMKTKQYMVWAMNKMSNDAFTIKLADRLHNIKYLIVDETKESKSFARWYIQQTEYIVENLERGGYSNLQNLLLASVEAVIKEI